MPISGSTDTVPRQTSWSEYICLVHTHRHIPTEINPNPQSHQSTLLFSSKLSYSCRTNNYQQLTSRTGCNHSWTVEFTVFTIHKGKQCGHYRQNLIQNHQINVNLVSVLEVQPIPNGTELRKSIRKADSSSGCGDYFPSTPFSSCRTATNNHNVHIERGMLVQPNSEKAS